MIAFEIPGEAIGKGRPRASRFGKGIRMHTPEKTVRYESLVALAAQQAMAGREPIAGAVALRLSIYTTPPASWSAKRRAAALAGEIRPTVKPDLDNVAKAVADALSGILYFDDKQIVEAVLSKHYSPMASVYVEVGAANG